MNKSDTTKGMVISSLSEKSKSNDKIIKTKHNSQDELIKDLAKQTKRKLSEISSKKPSPSDVFDIILEVCDVIYERNNIDKFRHNYYIYEPDEKIYISQFSYLLLIINWISHYCKIDDITTMARKIDDKLRVEGGSRGNLRKANFNPRYLRMFKNGILDLKTKTLYDFDDEHVSSYDYSSRILFDYVKECDGLALEWVKRTFDVWADKNTDNLKFLLQLVFATIEGYGREKYIVLKSNGGDGKSTFMRILENIASKYYTVPLNLHDLSDDNAVNTISKSTNLIIGDDLSTRFSMSGTVLSRFKSLVAGESFQAGMKFANNVNVQTNAVMIQATNTNISFYENTDAIADRFILYNWPSINFRRNPITDYNLDKLTGKFGQYNVPFMEACIWYAIENVEYFNKFTETKQMEMDSREMLDEADQIVQFAHFLEDNGVFEYEYMSATMLFPIYSEWNAMYGSSSNRLNKINFTRRFNKILENFGYDEDQEVRCTIGSLSSIQLDVDLFDTLIPHKSKRKYMDIIGKDVRTRFRKNPSNHVDKDQLNQFKEDWVTNKITLKDIQTNDKLKMIAKYLSTNDVDLRDLASMINEG